MYEFRPLVRAVATLTVAMVLISSPALPSEPPTKLNIEDQAAPSFTVYSTKDGLSDEVWNTVAFDRKGFVWAGSASELARFDGYRWKRWPLPEAKSLVHDLRVDGLGVLWALFEGEGLARFTGNRWTLDNDVPGPSRGFWATRPVDTGLGGFQLWMTGGDALWRRSVDGWKADGQTLPSQVIPAVGFAQTESLFGGRRQWIGGSDSGLWFRELSSDREPLPPWRRFEAPEFDLLSVNDLHRSVDHDREELWALSYGGGIVRVRDDDIRQWRSATGELPTEAMYQAETTVARSGEGTVWVASRAGLLRFRGDDLTVFDQRHGLPSNAVRRVRNQHLTDGTEMLWVATEGGLARAVLRESQWQTVSLLGARSNGTFAVLVEPDDAGGERLWVGSGMEGLSLLEGGEWRHFGVEDGTLPARGVRAVFRLPREDGPPWRLLSLLGGQLVEIADDLTFRALDPPWPLGNGVAANFALARAMDGGWEYWFATSHSGIYRWRGGEWTHFLADNGPESWSVLNFAEQVDASGRSWLWAATAQGLARFDGDTWTLLGGVTGLPKDGFRHVLVLPEVRGGAEVPVLWTSTSRYGFQRLDVSDPEHPILLTTAAPPPPPDPTVYSVLPDSRGRLWVCTNNGVQLLVRQADGQWDERVFRRPDGLVHDECNTNAQFVDRHDRYWLGTLGGLSVYEPRAEQHEVSSGRAPLYFTDYRIDGLSAPVPESHVVEVPPATREVNISYVLLTGSRELESTYRSQLFGYESSASAWTAEHSRSFTSLPPGSYQMIVEARDWAGTASPPVELTLRVKPRWWEHRWVQGLFGLILVLLSWGGVLVYNRGLRSRQRELQREVAARTSELRAANEQLTDLSYRDPLTGVANRRRLLELIDGALVRAAERELPLGIIVADVDDFKDYNDRWGHLVGDVALRAVAQELEQSCREQDLVARFGGEEFVCLLVDTDASAVVALAERMRERVEALPPRKLGNDQQGLTISLGTVSRVPNLEDRATDLLGEADAALYEAKRSGRNCVRSTSS